VLSNFLHELGSHLGTRSRSSSESPFKIVTDMPLPLKRKQPRFARLAWDAVFVSPHSTKEQLDTQAPDRCASLTAQLARTSPGEDSARAFDLDNLCGLRAGRI
jgi:hypothetical protein